MDPVRSMVRHADGRKFLDGWEGPEFNLICTDPPYNLNVEYAAHDDNMKFDQYIEMLSDSLGPAVKNLASDGQAAVFLPHKYTTELVTMMRGFGLYDRSAIIWAYTFGQHNANGLTQSFIPIHLFSKLKTRRTMNVADPRVRVPSNRQMTGDKRANPAGKTPMDVWVLQGKELKDQFGPDLDVWVESRVCGTFKERNKFIANQLPTALVDQLVLLLSNPGDVVYDGFCGSGTVGVSAVKHGRHFVGCDIDAATAQFAKERIIAAKGKKTA